MADEQPEVPAGHYRDPETGEIKRYERPKITDLGTLADMTKGSTLTTADVTNDGSS